MENVHQIKSYTIRYTVKDIVCEPKCLEYTFSQVKELWNGRDAITPRDIAELDIPLEDRTRVLSRLLCRLSPYRAKKLGRNFALGVAPLWDCPDITWWYLATGDKGAKDAAGWAAFISDRSEGVHSLARNAAWAAAWYPDGDVAWAVAWSGVGVAVLDAVWEAELEKYLTALVGAWEVTT